MDGTTKFPGRPALALTTLDVLGNTTWLYQHTLEEHILKDHPDMVGYSHVIQPCIENPDFVFASTSSGLSVVFESTAAGEGGRDLRVLVRYADTSFMAGGSHGTVLTAYPRDVIAYPLPNVGGLLYKKRS